MQTAIRAPGFIKVVYLVGFMPQNSFYSHDKTFMNRLSYFFRMFIPFALLLIAAAWLYGDRESANAVSQLRIRDEASVRVGAAVLSNKLESLSSDLLFLAAHSTTAAVVNRPTAENVAALADDFTVFSASKAYYDQIRWIDETGMERVRVDFRQGAPVRISNEQLQDKSKRYFFTETIKLKAGEVFVSPLDLNIEQGRIETPFKPMLRLATPVADQRGQNRGIVIVNYRGSDLLQAFVQAIGQSNAHNMLVNSDGYWLKSDSPSDEWGFMFNRPELNLAVRSPVAWRQVAHSRQGQLELDDGIWTWQAVYPLTPKRIAGASIANVADSYFWKVIQHDSTAVLKAIRRTIWLKVAAIVSLFLGVYGLACWKLADMWCLQAALKEKYRTVSDFAYDWETWVDPEGRYQYCSPSCARITGHPVQAFLDNPRLLIDLTHPGDRPYVEAHFAGHGEAEEVCQLVFRIVRPDGEISWLEHACQPVFDDRGSYRGRRASNRDITERKQIEARLVDSESYLRTIINNEPDCIKVVDAEGRLLQMNPAGMNIIEADSLEQVVGKPMANIIAPEYRNAYMAMHTRVLAGESIQMEYEIIGLKGSRRYLDTHAVPMKEAGGNVVHLAVTRDISERKQAERQLRIAAIVFESQEGMLVADADNNILRVNKAFTDVTGYSAEEVIGKNSGILHSGSQDRNFYLAMWESIAKTGKWEGEIWNRRKNGEIYPDYLTITAVKDQNGTVTHYVGTHTDITLRKAAAEEIERLAFYDPLTGLPNRRLLQDHLKLAQATSQRSGENGALLFIDLDNFKTLNDTLGHYMGDLLLKQVAERLNASVREGDTVARLGGDEFVVLLLNFGEQPVEAARQVELIGNKILTILNQSYKLGTHDYISTPSIGAALFCGQQHTVDALLKNADTAMYQAKSLGRNTFCFFDPEMQNAIAARFLLENELRKSLENRQFQLHYQLQVDGGNRPVGAEALIRWLHPVRGLMFPAEFIALAEETGLIQPIGQWVIESACAQLKAWQQSPLTSGLMLSVNVSAKQFFQADFALQVQAAIARNAIKPMLLTLELTESILIKNIEDTIATMNQLGKIGVQFSLDDFGTGYSSLQYLKKLPLNQLKIDKSFIRDIADDSGDQAIVLTIIAMAKSLNLNVIAEGVELEQQRQFLLNHGCLNYQGYLFSQPLPIAQFEALLRP